MPSCRHRRDRKMTGYSPTCGKVTLQQQPLGIHLHRSCVTNDALSIEEKSNALIGDALFLAVRVHDLHKASNSETVLKTKRSPHSPPKRAASGDDIRGPTFDHFVVCFTLNSTTPFSWQESSRCVRWFLRWLLARKAPDIPASCDSRHAPSWRGGGAAQVQQRAWSLILMVICWSSPSSFGFCSWSSAIAPIAPC